MPAPRPRSSRSKNICRERAGVEDVTFLTGFSFLGQGVNTAQAFITLKDWSERGPKDSAAAIVADINRDLSSIRDAKISALQPPPIDNLGNSSRLLVPPAGPRPEGLSGAGRRRRPADRGSQCQPRAAEGLCRGPAAGAAGQSDDRPRKGRRVRRHLRGHQPDHLDQSRLELHQRLPEPRPDAARDRAGRPRQPHERRRHPQLQRQEQPRATGAVLRLRHGAVVEGPDADRGLQLLSRRAHLRRSQARLHLRRRHRRDGAARRASCRAASATNGPGSRCRKSCRARRRRSCSASRCWWCSCCSPRSTKAGPFRSRCC